MTIKKVINRDKSLPIFDIVVGDEVACTDFEGLRLDVEKWLELKPFHKVKIIFSRKTDPILILEDIEGYETPKLNGKTYSFLGERFIKRKEDNYV